MTKMITFYLKQISPILLIGLAIILGLNFLGFTMNLLEGTDLLFRAIRGTTVISLILVLITTWKITKLDTSKENVTLASLSRFSETKKFFGKLFAAYLSAITVFYFKVPLFGITVLKQEESKQEMRYHLYLER